MQIQKLTNAQKTLAAFSFIAAALLSFYLSLPSEQDSSPLGVSSNEKTGDQKTQVNSVGFMQTAQKVQTQESNQIQNEKESTAATSAAESPKLWSADNVKAAKPTIPLNEQIAKYTIVEIDPHTAMKPSIGQTVSLPMLDGETVQVNVQSVSDNPNGDYTWSGHLKGVEGDYPVVMTYGENSVFATVTTPKGSYTMESVNGTGWLYKNPSEFELSKPGHKDYLEVDTVH